MNRRGKTAHGTLAAAFCLTLVLAGCVTTTSQTDEGGTEKLAGSLTEMFEQKLQGQDNEFVVGALERAIETGRISQADYDEAHRLYAACMSDAGYEESYYQESSGIWRITPPPLSGQENVEAYMAVGSDCSEELAPIESLYAVQQTNPDLLADPRQAVVECLRRSQLVGADYTAEDFEAEFESRFANAPYDPNDPEAQACFTGSGYAVSVQ